MTQRQNEKNYQIFSVKRLANSPGNPSNNPQLTQVDLPYYVKALAMALPAILFGIQISGWIFFVTPIREGHPDFRANYTAGVMVASGNPHELYDYDAIKAVQDRIISKEVVGMPFIHPAYESLVYAPFSFLKFRAAYCAFLVLNLLVVLVCYRLLREELQPAVRAWRPLPVLLGFTFLPIGAALMQGQDSILMLACFVWSWTLMRSRRDFAAGLVLGISIFRFQFLAPICTLLLLGKRWRILAGSMASSALCLLVSFAMVGLDGARTYGRVLASMSVGGVTALERARYFQPIGEMGSMRAMITGSLSHWLPASWIQITIFLVSLGIVAWVAYASRGVDSSDLLLLAVTTSSIVGYHIFIHDLAILLLPISVWLGRTIGRAGSNQGQGLRILLATTIMFAAPVLIVVRSVQFYWTTLAILLFLAAQLRELGVRNNLTSP